MRGEQDHLDFDPWAEDADAQIDRIVAADGPQLAKLRAFIDEGLHSSAARQEGAEAIKQRVRDWRERQARALDAALPEPGSPEEAAYIALIEQRIRTAETLPDIPHAEVAAKLDRIIARTGREKQ
jgi:hypothetical protein